MTVRLIEHRETLDVLRTLPDASVDAVVTDPPYALAELSPQMIERALLAWLTGDRDHVPDGPGGFMGQDWDRFVPPPAVWDECYRVLKPGGHLVVFAGSRTYDLMGISVRLSAARIRDGLAWLYGSGFPKGIDVGKAIDKASGATREVVGEVVYAGGHVQRSNGTDLGQMNDDAWRPTDGRTVTAPATPEAATWDGWNTALKPGHEPIVLARKPLVGTVAANVLEYGTGALNVDACRVSGIVPRTTQGQSQNAGQVYGADQRDQRAFEPHAAGRWPANVLVSHLPECNGQCPPGCAVAELDAQSGVTSSKSGGRSGTKSSNGLLNNTGLPRDDPRTGHDDQGGASRFFPTFLYNAKAPARERPKVDGRGHTTVKPLAVMRWLVRLVTPPGGVVLDPFAGSGTTGQACEAEGFDSILIDRDTRWAQVRLGTAAEQLEVGAGATRLPTAASEPVEQGEAMAEMIENVGETRTDPAGQAEAAAPTEIESVGGGNVARNPAGKRRDDFEDFPRGRGGRPKIIRAVRQADGRWVVPKDPDGNPIVELVDFVRASTLGGALEYQKGLARWEAAVALWGIVRSRTLAKRARAIDGYGRPDQKTELYEVFDAAKAYAESNSAANHGTALHSLFQRIAEGETVRQLVESGACDEDDVPAVQAFADALSRWDVLYCERRVVCDEAQAAGKYDLIVTARRPMPVTNAKGEVIDVVLPGEQIVVDNKTSSSADYFGEKFTVQLWVYAHGRDYDKFTGERTDVGCSKRWALILHVPSGTVATEEESAATGKPVATAEWHWVDLSIGEKLVRDAQAVLEDRRLGSAAIVRADLDAEIPDELLAARMREVAAGQDPDVPMHLAAETDQALHELTIDGVDGSGEIADREQAREWFTANRGRTLGELLDEAQADRPPVADRCCDRWHPGGTTCPDPYLPDRLERAADVGVTVHDPMFQPGEILPDGRSVEDVVAANEPADAELIDAIERELTAAEVQAGQEAGLQRAALLAAIGRAGSVDELAQIFYTADDGTWTEDVNAAATARRRELEAPVERPMPSAGAPEIAENLAERLQRAERDRVIIRTIKDATTVEQLVVVHARLVELGLWPGKWQALMTEARQDIESGQRFRRATAPAD